MQMLHAVPATIARQDRSAGELGQGRGDEKALRAILFIKDPTMHKIMCTAIAALCDVDRLPLDVGSIAPRPSVSRSGPGLRVFGTPVLGPIAGSSPISWAARVMPMI